MSLRSRPVSRPLGYAFAFSCGTLLCSLPANATTSFIVTNLVSDGSVPAAHVDPDLVNPWGVSMAPTGPFWVSDNGTGLVTLYNGQGVKLPLTVTVHPSPAAPTGQVFNGVPTDFTVSESGKSGGSVFMFATEDGRISGWSPGVALNHTVLAIDHSTTGLGAVYKALAIGTSGGTPSIYATDFRNGAVEQFGTSFNLIRSFTDSAVKPGYAPFGAQVLDNHLFVTYAVQDSFKHDDVAGPGNGYVTEFNLDGSFVRTIDSAGGHTNSPWGLAIAPSSFGEFAGDLLVGNFGDGTINAYNLTTGAFKGELRDPKGDPIVLRDLWALVPGNNALAGVSSKIYFTAGLAAEAHGLFGSLTAVPEPSSWMLMISGFGLVGMAIRRKRGIGVSFA
jgi:uncharacterized protein (TIGR03118 family)